MVLRKIPLLVARPKAEPFVLCKMHLTRWVKLSRNKTKKLARLYALFMSLIGSPPQAQRVHLSRTTCNGSPANRRWAMAQEQYRYSWEDIVSADEYKLRYVDKTKTDVCEE